MSRHVGTPDKFKPQRDRLVRGKAVACPVCGAEVGQSCFKQDGVTTTLNVHPRRRRIAYEAGH